MNLTGIFVIFLFIYAFFFLFFGPTFMRRKKSAVGRFNAIRKSLRDWTIEPSLLPSPLEVASLCNTEFLHVSPSGTKVNGVEFKHRNLGDIVDIVHFRERALRRTLRELRVYAFVVLALGGLGFLRFLKENGFRPEFVPFLRWIDAHPLELVAGLEAIMLGALTIRLAVESMTIAELIDDQ